MAEGHSTAEDHIQRHTGVLKEGGGGVTALRRSISEAGGESATLAET